MAFYTLIGLIVVAAVLALGMYWVVTNLSFKRQSERILKEYVQDNSKGEQNDPKA